MSKHTPGPWHIKSGFKRLSVFSGEYKVAEILQPVHKLDAHLISSAPDMLEILKQVERVYGDRYPDVVNVIAKAEGRV